MVGSEGGSRQKPVDGRILQKRREQAGRYAAGSGGRDGRGSVDVTGQNGGEVTSPGTPSL